MNSAQGHLSCLMVHLMQLVCRVLLAHGQVVFCMQGCVWVWCVCVCVCARACVFVCVRVCEQVSVARWMWDWECVRCALHVLQTQYLTNLVFFLVDSNLEGVADASISFPGVSRCCPLNHSLALCSVLEGLSPALERLERKPPHCLVLAILNVKVRSCI